MLHLGGHGLIIVLQMLLQVIKNGLIRLQVEHSRGQSLLASSARATHSMNVLSDVCRCVVVDDMSHVFDVNTTSHDIGAH